MFTSRAEARLLLRHDNADQRLSPKGKEIGLLEDSDWERFNKRRDRIARLRNTLDLTRFKRSSTEYAGLSALLGIDLGDAITLSQLAMRPGVSTDLLMKLLPFDLRNEIKGVDMDTALADSLYSGYVEKQKLATERVNHHDTLRVPEDFQFNSIGGLSIEMVERLERARPSNFAQVRQINGLTPAALSTVLVHLTAHSPSETIAK